MADNHSPFELPSLDPSRKAAEELDVILSESKDENEDISVVDERLKDRITKKTSDTEADVQQSEQGTTEENEKVVATQARSGERIITQTVDREGARILLLTRDTNILNPESLSSKRILELSQLFPEIHIIVLTTHTKEPQTTARIADNVWLYATNSNSWWRTPYDAYRLAREQLSFAGGFRADIIIAEDSFESGIAGYFLARAYERPFQVHVLEDIYDVLFKESDPHNELRLFVAPFILKRADCIRVRSQFVLDHIIEEHNRVENISEVLPFYRDLTTWRDMAPSFNLHERYPQFKFIMLHVSSMRPSSYTDRVLNAATITLKQYRTVGLVIVGNGPMRASLEKQAINLGIQSQVIFEPTQQDIISHLKTANILIHLSESSDEDDVILGAGTVKLPMIVARGGLASELFVDGESAFFCASTDSSCVSIRINEFLNQNQIRARFALNAHDAVLDRVEQDYDAYLLAYKASIERCVRNVE